MDIDTTSNRGRLMIERLRKEPFNIRTEERLSSHPYIKSAENGSLTLEQRRAFVCEQFAIQQSDAASFGVLAGHKEFSPRSLAKAVAPEPIHKDQDTQDLFQFLLGGEIFAAELLLKHAKSLGLQDEKSLASHKFLSAGAQAYPSYWARLARDNKRAPAAAACAVNFPAWGRMCRRLHQALATNTAYGYSGVEDEGLSFVNFFATPIEDLDEMAAVIIEREGVSYEELLEPVRLLQEYEIMFWDAITKES